MKRCADRQHANENTTFNQKLSTIQYIEVFKSFQSVFVTVLLLEIPCQHVTIDARKVQEREICIMIVRYKGTTSPIKVMRLGNIMSHIDILF